MKRKVRSFFSVYSEYPTAFGYDNPYHQTNSDSLRDRFGLKGIQWLKQSHSANVCQAPTDDYFAADAVWTRDENIACAILTADCLPIFLCNEQATQVAAVHAGWKGLANGVLRNILASFAKGDRIYTAFGPAIGATNYEVGDELLEQFSKYEAAFKPHPQSGKHYLSLYELTRMMLLVEGVEPPPMPDWCTYRDKDIFPSYRRDNKTMDRIANLIWLSGTE